MLNGRRLLLFIDMRNIQCHTQGNTYISIVWFDGWIGLNNFFKYFLNRSRLIMVCVSHIIKDIGGFLKFSRRIFLNRNFLSQKSFHFVITNTSFSVVKFSEHSIERNHKKTRDLCVEFIIFSKFDSLSSNLLFMIYFW